MSGSWSNTQTNLIVLVEQISGYSGIFGYSPAPGAGNLVFSLTAAAGTDPYGNAYLAGMALYKDETFTALDTLGNKVTISPESPTGGQLASLPGVSFQVVGNTGDPAVIGALNDGAGDLSLLLTSPSPTTGGVPGTDFAQINMTGPYNSNPPSITMNADAPGGTINLNSLTIDENAVISSYGFDSFNTYTPTVVGDGAATYSTQTGYWQRLGPMIFFTAFLVVNNAGTGATEIGISAPTSIDRTTRQRVGASTEGLTAGNNGSSTALAFNSGSGSRFDRLRNFQNGSIVGSDLQTNGIITIEGWYRAA